MSDKRVQDLPVATASADTDLYLVIQTNDRKQTLLQLKVAVGTSGTNLEALLNLLGAADKLAYFTGANAMGLADFTAAGRDFVAQASLADMRTLLAVAGAGNNTDITQLSGLAVALSIAQGGTGGQSVNAGRANLGARANENLLDNSNFRVNQRAYVSGTATTVAMKPTLDRWKVVVSGQNLAFSASGSGNSVTCPAGGLEQACEGLNIAASGVHTLSWTGTATATVNGTAVTNGGQTPSLTAGTDYTVRFSNGTLSKPKLEFGTVASSYEGRALSEEIKRCERWYEAGNVTYSGDVTSAGSYIATDKFRTLKRTTPVLTLASIYATNFATTTLAGTPTTRDITITRVATGTGVGSFGISYTADSE